MAELKQRIETLLDVFEKWLSPDNLYLQEAIDKTIEEGYFNFPDVKYAVLALKEKLNRGALHKWVSRSGVSDKYHAEGKNVLCLHAGNLPLVGFQDALAVLLSGARYTGKISRKDPYLLPIFLNEVKNTQIWGARDVQWSHHLDDFEGMQNDAILFAGSEQSVSEVRKAINRLNLEKNDTRYLIRTAHFSMAYFDKNTEKSREGLVEGIFRYGGKGCRSVAVVVSPFALDEVRRDLTDTIKAFWNDNPQHFKPKPKLKQRFAYNKAIERSQIWLEDFLLQEGGLELDQDFICYWLQGDEKQLQELAARFGGWLQSVYVIDSGSTMPELEQEVELLSGAQNPPIYWEPDGVDILAWLCEGSDV